MEALDDNDSEDLVEIDLCVIDINFDAGVLPTSSKKYLQISSCVNDDGMETAVTEGSLDEVIDMMGFGKFQVGFGKFLSMIR